MAAAAGGRAPRPWVALLAVWPAVLVVALLWPLLTRGGHPLARDLVFLPRQPLTWDALGLGDGSPRAVPLDAVLAVVTAVVDGGVVARLVLPAILLVAAWGVARLVPWVGPVGVLVACGVTVWNPFVVERLALGQWALLTAYAALPWLVRAADASERDRGLGGVAPVVGWSAVASLTPTGGLLALLVVALRWLRRRPGSVLPLVAVLALQAPWVVAGLVGPTRLVSDPVGVAAFAPDTEGPWGTTVALLGLGGIWDSNSEPASRATLLAPLTALAVVVVVAVAARELWSRLVDRATWATLALGGLALALLATTPAGQAGARFLVAHVPAAGLLRDTQKLLLPAALVVAVASGVAADRLVRLLRRVAPASPELVLVLVVPVVLAPLLLLPDGARVVWRTVDPVDVPNSFAEVDRLTRSSDHLLVTLPWRGYRRFAWGNGSTSSDPATRALHARVLTSDDLQVGDTLVRGEGPLAREVGAHLEDGGAAADLADRGVGWVLLYLDDPDAGTIDVTGLRRELVDEHVALYAVPGATVPGRRSATERTLVLVAYAVALGMLVAAGWGAVRRAADRVVRRRR